MLSSWVCCLYLWGIYPELEEEYLSYFLVKANPTQNCNMAKFIFSFLGFFFSFLLCLFLLLVVLYFFLFFLSSEAPFMKRSRRVVLNSNRHQNILRNLKKKKIQMTRPLKCPPHPSSDFISLLGGPSIGFFFFKSPGNCPVQLWLRTTDQNLII